MEKHRPQTSLIPDGRDVGLAFSLLIVSMLSGLYIDAARPDTEQPSALWQWVLICIPPVLVAYRATRPSGAVILVTIAQVAIWITNLPAVLLSVFVILYTTASTSEPNRIRLCVASSIVLTIVTGIGVQIADDVTVYQLPLVALTCATAITLGLNAKRQERLAAELSERAALVKLQAENERSQAIADERSHIGRELHDIVGHALSVIAVRAESADRVAETRPEVARHAVGDIAIAARTALDDTRRVLAGLRHASTAELSPPPDLKATVRLVEQLAASGIDVTLHQTGCEDDPPSAVVSGGVYRIVQESLTNAIKHAGGGTIIDVEVTCHPRSIDLRVTNTAGPEAPTSEHRRGGSGIAGMSERVEILGGTFSAIHNKNGTFIVSATIPNHEASTGRHRP